MAALFRRLYRRYITATSGKRMRVRLCPESGCGVFNAVLLLGVAAGGAVACALIDLNK